MFTLLCHHCQKEVIVDNVALPGTMTCNHCSQTNNLEQETHYCPRLIVIQGGQKGKEFFFKNLLTMGRDTANTIQLKELKSSRRHAQIKFAGNSYILEDLNSGNGTFLNGNKISQNPLRDKDLIHIAETIFMYRNPYNYSPGVGGAEPSSPQSSSPVKRGHETVKTKIAGSKPVPELVVPQEAVLAETQSEFERTRAELKFDAQRSFMMSSQELQNIAEVEKANSKLRILYEVNHAISSILDLHELLGAILDVVFKYIPAERGSILLYDAEKNELEKSVSRMKDASDTGPFKISKTMMDKVLKDRVSLLTTDAMMDDSFSGAMSIISQGIRSAMSVPLISKEKLLGVLHIDTTQVSHQFNADTLELLTGIASQSAIAIENARLLKKIEKELETRGHLQRYLSPDLVEQIINNQITMGIGGELKKATVLFTDLRGFTKLTESIGAEAIVAILNDYFTRMVDVIFTYDGTLDKFIGDAIMAIWGLPIGRDTDALMCIKAAIYMQQELFYFNLAQRQKGRSQLKMGAGINTGELVVGNMGSPKRMEYTVIGPPVNLASRVESLTAHNQILISENTYAEVENKVHGTFLPPTPLKGIKRPIKIFGIASLKDDDGHVDYFLPVLIYDQDQPTFEGLLKGYENGVMELHIELTEALKAGGEYQFIFDIPSISPSGVVKINCRSVEQIISNGDEYNQMFATLIDMPDDVKQFLDPVFD